MKRAKEPCSNLNTWTHRFSYVNNPATLLLKENRLAGPRLPVLERIPLMTHCFPGNYKQLGGPSTSAEKAEPGGIKCDYMKPKSLHGQVISRFKKALQETAMSDVYRGCSLSDERSGTRRPQEPGEETDIEHHKLQKDDSVLFGGIKTYGLHYTYLRQQQREVLYFAGGFFWLVLCGILCHLFF